MSTTGTLPNLDRIGRSALTEVIEALLGWSAAEQPPTEVDRAWAGGERLRATVQLTGPHVSGVVQLQLPPVFATQAVVRLLGESHPRPPGDVELRDFAGELANMLAGQVAARLRLEGYPCGLSSPEVALGGAILPASLRAPPSLPAHEPARVPGCHRTEWSCQGQWLTLELRLGCGTI